MTFNEANTVEAHLRDLRAAAASARPAQSTPHAGRMSGKVAGVDPRCNTRADVQPVYVGFGAGARFGTQV
jgi:hypothetical protein